MAASLQALVYLLYYSILGKIWKGKRPQVLYYNKCSLIINLNSHTDYQKHIIQFIIKDVSVAEWLAWLTSNCGRICAIGSSPSNGLKPNLWGQKPFNPLCQCVYVYVWIVNPDIQTIHRCSHTSIHTYIYTYIHTYIHEYMHTYMYAYIHTCIHTYIHTYMCLFLMFVYFLFQDAAHFTA